MRIRPFVLALVVVLSSLVAVAEEPLTTRLLRFPDIGDDRIAFVYAGDIWVVDAAGGVARRLTSHEGLELFPKFSPDGRWIAFSGEYSGTRQVHVISVDGGEPRQLTFQNDVGALPPRGGFDYQVLGWTPDGKSVLFNANRLPWSERMGRPYVVPASGGKVLPARFRREAQVVAALDHPNIAAIFGLEESNGVSRFLMLRAASAEVPEPIRLVQNWEAILTERSDAAP